ncbi:NAD-dependent epimerase/dehydratase family protein [Chloroflexota bacterium]
MKNVAITGISGYIGTRLLSRLDGIDSVQKIIGIDIKEPAFKSAKLKFCRQNILEPFGALLTENEVDAAVHLAFILRPTRDRVSARQIDVDGTLNFVRACRQARVGHVLYLSSHTVYGAHEDNPIPLTEDSPPRPVPDFQYSSDKARTEQIMRDFGTSDRNVTITILRSCPVIGPNAIGSAPTIMFKPPVMVGVARLDPPMQFVHEDDLVKVIETLLAQKRGGIFNVAGDGELKYSEVARMVGKKLLMLPDSLLKFVISLSWALHLQNESPVSGLEFVKYPPVVSTDKLARETGFRFQYSTEEALSSFVSAVRNQ